MEDNVISDIVHRQKEGSNDSFLQHFFSRYDDHHELEDILYMSVEKLEMYCKAFLPHIFYRPFSDKIHKPMFELLDDRSIQQVAIAAPRGGGKTSIIGFAYPSREILFKTIEYLVYVSETETSAVEYTENIKWGITTNEDISEIPDWANMKPSYGTGEFGKKAWTTSNGVRVLPRGRGQQIRGKNWRGRRPDLLIFDDIEDDESVLSEERRDYCKDWVASAAKNIVDRGSKSWRIICVGTVLHPDSFLMAQTEKTGWESVILELCDNTYVSAWPEYMGNEEVKNMAEEYREDGRLDVFHREFRNVCIAPEEQSFKNFQTYNDIYSEEELTNNPLVETAIFCDPARTMKTGSNNTAIMGISVDTVKGEIFVRDIEKGHFNPDEVIQRTLDMAYRLGASVLCPEVTGLHEYIMFPLRNEMMIRGVYYHTMEIKPREGKTGPRRSGGLIPLYRNNRIFHNRNICGSLEEHLMNWPRPREWDEIDCLSGIIFALDEGGKFFSPQSDIEKSPEDMEKEYSRLEEDYDDEEFPYLVGNANEVYMPSYDMRS